MRLTIVNVSAEDFGSYRCVAKNSQGQTDGQIRLYGKLSVRSVISAFDRTLICRSRINRHYDILHYQPRKSNQAREYLHS